MNSDDSFLEWAGIYMVENVTQATLALLLVLVVIRFLAVNDPGLRVKFLLLPIILPLVGPPTYYTLFPSRQDMPVFGVDQILSVEAALRALDWHAHSHVFTWVTLIAIALSLTGAALSIIGVLYMSRLYATLPSGGSPSLDYLLIKAARRLQIFPPRVLLSPDSGPLCGTCGLLRPYLLLSPRLLDGLEPASLEAVVTHEMAHLRRRDNLLQLFIVVIRRVLFFNPAVAYLCNRILLETEKDCDRMALKSGIPPSVYVQSMHKVWQLGTNYPERTEQFACRFLSPRGHFRERAAALSGEDATLKPWQEGAWYTTAALLAVGLFFLC